MSEKRLTIEEARAILAALGKRPFEDEAIASAELAGAKSRKIPAPQKESR